MVEMSLDSIRLCLMNYQCVVILKEKSAERYLPIWVGPVEAHAIATELNDVTVRRPVTHELLHSVIAALGASVNSIVVSDLRDDAFCARITLDLDGGQVEIDSRPSDAIALAVRVEAPIYAEEAVLDKAGVLLDRETGKLTPSSKVSKEKLGKVSAFRHFINSLDLDDFDD